jgi:NAD(P)-dependent dehydrogenase (short-subunit alcohol dehydrogenase family)
MSRFEGKVAIVTGAAKGLGAVFARALAQHGAAVVVADRNENGKEVADDIGGTFIRTDVADPDAVQAMAEHAVERFGGIDYLVNNAAICGSLKFDFLIGVDWDYYKNFMGVNMDGALLCTRACYPRMAERGGGAIVNMSSEAAWLYSSFYGLAKAGVNSMTQQLAHELGGMNIRVNAIASGLIDNEATRRNTPEEIAQDMVKSLDIKRMGTPDDLVGMCLFLLSDEASWITGQIFNVDGGQVFRS